MQFIRVSLPKAQSTWRRQRRGPEGANNECPTETENNGMGQVARVAISRVNLIS